MDNNLVVISDAGRDIDDELAFILLASSIREGKVKLLGVVANLAPALERACLIKGQLNEHGIDGVPVACGMAVNENIRHTSFETMASYKASAAEVEQDGQKLLRRLFSRAQDNSITLLLISGMTDANKFFAEHTGLFTKKINKVVIMGGVLTSNTGQPLTDGQGRLLPDSSYNNHVDENAAEQLYKNLQQHNIPTTIVSRFAVYKAAVSHEFFDAPEFVKSKIGKRIKTRHKTFTEDFWRTVNLAPDDPERLDFPPRMNQEWFMEKFTDNRPQTLSAMLTSKDIHSHISKINLYDVVTMMAAINDSGCHFKPVEHGCMSIIGLSEKIHGIINPALLKQDMHTAVISGLQPSGRLAGL